MKIAIIIIVLLLIALCLFSLSNSSMNSPGSHHHCNNCGPGCRCGSGCQCRPGHGCGPACKYFTGYSEERLRENMDGDIQDEKYYDGNCEKLTDSTCKAAEARFKKFDSAASILPGIGLPSQNNGVCTILHGMGSGAKKLKINGLESSSPLANAALFSTECTGGKSLNLYEMMLPEGLSSTPGELSAAEAYTKELNNSGINVAGTHWHWWASDPYVSAIHHQNVGMNPVDFVNKTTTALDNYKHRSGM